MSSAAAPLGESPAVQPDPAPEYCQAHLERTGAQIPVFRLGLCRDCWAGSPIGDRRRRPELTDEQRKKRAEQMRERRKDPKFIRRWRAAIDRRCGRSPAQ
jgi:hypothetical protein